MIVCCCSVSSIYVVWKSFSTVNSLQDKVYILANGKAIEAFASDRKENIPVEAKDHVKTFHTYFFTLDPDDKVIKDNISKALYLADGSAKNIYNDLRENGYYSNIISGNISQEIRVDSVVVDISNYPFSFRCYAEQKIIRPASIVKRRLITQGELRNVSRSDNNPHGFLIERWKTMDNQDISTEQRRP
jgi:conjugative transposon TraK protein